MSIKNKIMGGFIAITVIAVLIIMFTLPALMERTLDERQISQLDRTVGHILNLINKDLDKSSNYINLIGNDQIMGDATFLATWAGDIVELKKNAKRLYESFGLSAINFYDSGGEFLLDGHTDELIGEGPELGMNRLGQLKKSASGNFLAGLSSSPNGFSISAISPIMYDADLIGVVAIAIDLDNKYLKKIAKLSHANVSLAFENKIVASNRADLLNTTIDSTIVSAGQNIFKEDLIENELYSTVSSPLKNIDGQLIGTIIVSISKNDILEAERKVQGTIFVILFVILILSLMFGFYIVRAISVPIDKVIKAAKAVADGDLDYNIEVSSKDEMGQMAGELNRMLTTLKNAFMSIEERTDDLGRSETRMRAILESVGEGIITIYDDGKIESINPSAEEIFCLKKNDIVGHNSSVLLKDETNNPFQAEKTEHPLEYEGKRFDGSLFSMELVVTQMLIGENNMRVCVVRDITRRKEAEAQLVDMQAELITVAHKSGMADMATGVLHNIGNILNSVNVAADEILRILKNSKISGLLKANTMLNDHIDDIGNFLTNDKKGKMLPPFYIKLGDALSNDFKAMSKEIQSLSTKITMMREVISTQQTYATGGLNIEDLDINKLVEDAIKVQEASLNKYGVTMQKEYGEIPKCSAQKSKLLQVVTNIIKNAKEAMFGNDTYNKPKEILIKTGIYNEDFIYINITDNGCGISEENLVNVFNHGFTTKEGGHGFGLHSAANALTEMKGKLGVTSEGEQLGARFKITLPVCKPTE